MPPAPESSPAPRAALAGALPWIVAAFALLAAAFLLLQAEGARAEADSLRLQLEVRDLELRDARNRQEGERLLRASQAGAAGRGAPETNPAGNGKN
jgi:hypothetical protein